MKSCSWTKCKKNKYLADPEVKELRDKKLIEGRKPNFYISSIVAKETGQRGEYLRLRGIDDEYCMKLIIDYLKEFKKAKKADFSELLENKLPDVLSKGQKQHKIKNLLQKMKKDGLIDLNNERYWVLN
jgi:ATP-dependent DNA helicase RecG